MSAVLKHIPDPPLDAVGVLDLLEKQIRKEGVIDLANGVIYFDPLHEEETGTEGDRVTFDVVPCFILEKFVNGEKTSTAHISLIEALRGLE